MSSLVGRTVSHYEVLSELGRGGMGIVYRARDLRLRREVALKVLPPETVADVRRRRRFLAEARAAAVLSHPNIGVIHEIDEADGSTFIAMELVQGGPLSTLLMRGPLPLSRGLDLGLQVAEGLARAHEKGIVHRDLKPANVMVTEEGTAKIIDFGLAKLVEQPGAPDSELETATGGPTGTGVVVGTAAYMSPEQARGQEVDPRSDVFSFGVMLYEMLSGHRPFEGATRLDTLHAIVGSLPPALTLPTGEDATDLQRILDKCLAKDPADRYQGTRDLAVDLRFAKRRLDGSMPSGERPSEALPAWTGRRRALTAVGVLALVAAVGLGVRLGLQQSRARWARNVALPEVSRLAGEGRMQDAFRLARQAAAYLPGDPQVLQQIKDITHLTRIESEPPGASAFLADYLDPKAEWELAGTTPVAETRVPYGLLRWKLTRDGCDDLLTTAWAGGGFLQFRLMPRGAVPPEMVTVAGGRWDWKLWGGGAVDLDEFWIDRYEVTNAEYKGFVDAGGYKKREYWKEPFVRDGRPLTREEAMTLFRDRTGRPGPANWLVGSFPEGAGEQPVGGVSWYEAAAFAVFAGKNLPTLHHWGQAALDLEAGTTTSSEIPRLANFGGQGPWPVGRSRSIGRFGTYDHFGNVSEWCSTASKGKRYFVGGSWNDATYMAESVELGSPLERPPTRGFRCAKYSRTPSEKALAPFAFEWSERTWGAPVDEKTFEIYRALYSSPPRELRVATVGTEETPDWRRETVTFDAGYREERLIAHLFLPKQRKPPYQTVLYFPYGWALALKSSQELEMRWLGFLLRSGRAVLCPVFIGTYERRAKTLSADMWADWTVSWAKEVRRSVDYLETREDIDKERIAYYGFSLGAQNGPIFAVTETRFRTMVLLAGGLFLEKVPPHVDPLHFAPRAKTPILMVNGKDDFTLQKATRRMYELLGTPPEHKRLALIEGGHAPARLEDVIREVLDWLDRYLGPV